MPITVDIDVMLAKRTIVITKVRCLIQKFGDGATPASEKTDTTHKADTTGWSTTALRQTDRWHQAR
jgi:hypothetical protein